MKQIKILLILLAALMVSNCKVFQNQLAKHDKASTLADSTDLLSNMEIPEDWMVSGEDTTVFSPEWISEFLDSKAQDLVRQTYLHNQDIKLAALRVDQAQLGIKIAHSRLLPTVGFGLNEGVWNITNGPGPDVALLKLNWEVDVFGKNRYKKKGATAAYYSTEQQLEYIKYAMATQTLRFWYSLMGGMVNLRLYDTAIDINKQMKEIIDVRSEVGASSLMELRLIESNIIQLEEQRMGLQELNRELVRSIHLITGQYPLSEMENVPNKLPVLTKMVPDSVSSTLLDTRPDIMAAQYMADRAFYEHGAARKARLPIFNIGFNGGYLGTNPISLNTSSWVNAFVGGLTAPIYAGGALKTNVEIKMKQREEAMEFYAKTVLKALKELETSHSNIRNWENRKNKLMQAEDKLIEYYRLSKFQYDIGNEDLYILLSKQIDLLLVGAQLVNVHVNEILSRLNFYQSLGGNYEDLININTTTP